MKTARMLVVIALVIGFGQATNGQGTQQDTQAKIQAQRDQVKMAVQEICPITGQKLGTNGPPVKVKIGEEILFVGSKDSLTQQISTKHWATIHANFAKAQRICPVMKKTLPASPKWTIVEGQIIYICCPPCTKKIVADPKTYVQQVNELYTASLNAKKVRR